MVMTGENTHTDVLEDDVEGKERPDPVPCWNEPYHELTRRIAGFRTSRGGRYAKHRACNTRCRLLVQTKAVPKASGRRDRSALLRNGATEILMYNKVHQENG
jgi:hypothetical protein